MNLSLTPKLLSNPAKEVFGLYTNYYSDNISNQVTWSGATTFQVRFDQFRSDQIRLDQIALYCTNVEVKVKVALLYSTKCNQTQRGGGGVVFSDYNTTLVNSRLDQVEKIRQIPFSWDETNNSKV